MCMPTSISSHVSTSRPHAHGVGLVPGAPFHAHGLEWSLWLKPCDTPCVLCACSLWAFCTQGCVCTHALGTQATHLTCRDDVEIESLTLSSMQCPAPWPPGGHSCTGDLSVTYTHSLTIAVSSKLLFLLAHSPPPNPTLSRNLTLGLSQHPHLQPPGPSAGLQLQQVTPFLPCLCFSFLLFPLRNLVPVRKPKPSLLRAQGQAGVAR